MKVHFSNELQFILGKAVSIHYSCGTGDFRFEAWTETISEEDKA
jgi:hypothetical protein